ncbi:MAG: GHKL domain-containing protein, partial [Lachnospiraceae bacterium]|nr:GHKL domain-containing protein [Lachnospiraceae bacterium]
HGWGLRSIKDIAEIHNGSVDIYEKDGMFTVNILLMKDA